MSEDWDAEADSGQVSERGAVFVALRFAVAYKRAVFTNFVPILGHLYLVYVV